MLMILALTFLGRFYRTFLLEIRQMPYHDYSFDIFFSAVLENLDLSEVLLWVVETLGIHIALFEVLLPIQI